jgi:predicted ATPase
MRRMLCPSLVGRDDELASLLAGLDDLQDGRGGCLLLAGEPGIGKSRLAREAAAAAQRRGVTVLFGRASPTGASVAYQCLTSALLHGLRSSSVDASDLQPLRAGLTRRTCNHCAPA